MIVVTTLLHVAFSVAIILLTSLSLDGSYLLSASNSSRFLKSVDFSHNSSISSSSFSYFNLNFYQDSHCKHLKRHEVRKINVCLNGMNSSRRFELHTSTGNKINNNNSIIIAGRLTQYNDNSCSSCKDCFHHHSIGPFLNASCENKMSVRLSHSLPMRNRKLQGATLALLPQQTHCKEAAYNHYLIKSAMVLSYLQYGQCDDRDSDLPDVKWTACGSKGVKYYEFSSTNGSCTGEMKRIYRKKDDFCLVKENLLGVLGYVIPFCPFGDSW